MANLINKRDEKENTPLIILARSKLFSTDFQLFLLDKLLEAGAYLNLGNYKFETALVAAVKNNKIDMVQKLLKYGANPNIQNYRGKTALMIAVEENYPDIVRILLDYCDPDIQNIYGETALMVSILVENFRISKMLIEKGANLDIQDYYYKKTPLMQLVETCYCLEEDNKVSECREIIILLITLGADIKIKDHSGEDLLMYMALYAKNDSDLEIIKLLLDSGMDPNSLTYRGITSITYAWENYSMCDKIMELLLEKGADLKLLNSSCDLSVLNVLWNIVILAGIDIPISELLDANADPNFRIRDTTLLHKGLPRINVDAEYTKLYKSLFRKGANPNLLDSQGNSLLAQICSDSENYDPELVRFLVDSGADPNYIDRFGRNLLMILYDCRATENSYLVAEILVEKGINVNYKRHDGHHALFYYCLFPRQLSEYELKMIRLLILSGSDVTVKNTYFDSIFRHVDLSYLVSCITEKAIIDDNKKKFSKILKKIKTHSSAIRLNPDNNGAKILEYCYILDNEGEEKTFKKIETEDPYLLDYLNIQKLEDINLLYQYKDLL